MITYYLYKKGYFVSENLGQLMKISTGIGLIVVLSYCIRGFGRSQSETYRRFVRDLQEAKDNYNSPSSKKKLRRYDFEFEHWPIDWSMKTTNIKDNNAKKLTVVTSARGTVNWISPCSVAAYLAIHTFGIKMVNLKLCEFHSKIMFFSCVYTDLSGKYQTYSKVSSPNAYTGKS